MSIRYVCLSFMIAWSCVFASDNKFTWKSAKALSDQGAYGEAVVQYRGILRENPGSTKAATLIAINQFNSGDYAAAFADAEAAIAIDPWDKGWAADAYLIFAKASFELGHTKDASSIISMIQSRFPDTPAATEAALFEIRMDGKNSRDLELALVLEQKAQGLAEQAIAIGREGDIDRAIRIYDKIIKDYSDTRTALRAREYRAYTLSRLPEYTKASQEAFEDIVARTKKDYPDSRIRYEAEFRIAALYQRQDKRYEAMRAYEQLASISKNPKMAVEAAFQAVGAHNEMLQLQTKKKRSRAGHEDWETLRQRCQETLRLEGLSGFQRGRIELIAAESYAWEFDHKNVIKACDAIIATYSMKTYPRTVAMAHFLAGESQQLLGDQEQALSHFQAIVDEFGYEEIWGYVSPDRQKTSIYLADQPRLRLNIIQSKKALGVSDEEINQLVNLFLKKYPDSRYAKQVREFVQTESVGQ